MHWGLSVPLCDPDNGFTTFGCYGYIEHMVNIKSIIVILSIASLAIPAAASGKQVIQGPIAAKVIKVMDGDTLQISAKIWLDQTMVTSVRISGIDTPELDGKCKSESNAARVAKRRLKDFIGKDQIRLTQIRNDKYAGRVVANVARVADGADAAKYMLSKGLAREYGGGKRQGWCD